jgi:hypothetical protein
MTSAELRMKLSEETGCVHAAVTIVRGVGVTDNTDLN